LKLAASRAKGFDSALQALEAATDLTHDRKCGDADRHREQHQQKVEQEPGVAVPDRYAGNQPSTVGEMDVRHGPVLPGKHPHCVVVLRVGRGQQATDGGGRAAVLIEQGHIGVEPGGEPSQRLLLLGRRRGGGRQHVLHEPSEGDTRLLGGAAGEMP
jgi:hypothetical protein